MGEKLVTFVVLAIIVGAIGPIFGQSGAKGNESDQLKVAKSQLLAPLNNLVDSIFGALAIAKPSEFTKLVNYQCGTYSSTEAVFEGVLAGLELINERNCSKISEIEKIEENTLSAVTETAENIYSGIRSIDTKYANSGNEIGASEEEAISEWTEALRSIFLAVKIILSDMCPGNPLVIVKDSVESLNAAEEEANTQIKGAVHTMFNPITKIYTSSIGPLFGNIGGKVDSIAIDSGRNTANDLTTKLLHNVFSRLRLSLLDIMKEQNDKNKESCSVK